MDNSLFQDMVSRLPVSERVSLIKNTLSLGSDVSVSPTSDADYFRFTFWDKQVVYRIETILCREGFPAHLNNLIDKARKTYQESQTVLEALSEEKEFDINEFYLDEVPKAQSEDKLAEIFEGNHQALIDFYHSPNRVKLDLPTRGFLLQVVQNPFLPLWDNDVN